MLAPGGAEMAQVSVYASSQLLEATTLPPKVPVVCSQELLWWQKGHRSRVTLTDFQSSGRSWFYSMPGVSALHFFLFSDALINITSLRFSIIVGMGYLI